MKYRTNKLCLITASLAIFLVSLISGCGQSGPLYLPDQNPPTTAPTSINE